MDDVVMVGIDGSPGASRALEVGIAEALARRWPLRLVCAFPPSLVSDPTVDSGYAAREKLQATALLEEAAEPARRFGLHVTSLVQSGEPRHVLAHQSKDAGLVVVGKHGHAVLERVMGSVSFWLAAHAECPTIVVPPAGEDKNHGPSAGQDVKSYGGMIVAALDGETHQEPLIDSAVQVAKSHNVPLALLIVTGASGDHPDWSRAESMIEQLRQTIRQEHADLKVSGEIVPGKATEVLIGASRTADMMLLGTRGHSGLPGLLIGSVSQAVLHEARCPVMVVRQAG